MSNQSNARFNAEAAAWDSNPDVHRASDGALHALLEAFPHLRDLKDKATAETEVLEIGTGTGLLSLRLSPYVGSILAVDAADGMIDALGKKLSDPGAPSNIHPLCMLLEDPEDPRLPPSDAGDGARRKFDLVISHLCLHHIPSLPPLLRTMLGCLRPGGEVALTDFEDFGPEARKFHPEAKMAGVERHGIRRGEMAGTMREVGFEGVSVEVAWRFEKEVERWPGEWGQEKPGGVLQKMEFPFVICRGRRPA